MKNSIDKEKVIFNYILKEPKYLVYICKDFFTNPDIDMLANMAREFHAKYNQTPTPAQMFEACKDNTNEDSQMLKQIIKGAYKSNIDQYDEAWLKDTTEGWIAFRSSVKGLERAVTFVKTADISLENVSDVVTTIHDYVAKGTNVSFDDDLGLDFFDHKDHKQEIGKKVKTSYEFLDNGLGGGYDNGTLNVYLGKPNVGKSIYLANDAANFMLQGKNVALITCEMSAKKFLKRIDANLLNMSISDVDRLSQDEKLIQKKLKAIKTRNLMLPLGSLRIKQFATSTATVFDIENYILEIQKRFGYKIDAIVIDYINILKNYRNPNSEDMYMKIKQICEDLRAVAQRLDCVIISATQIGRKAWSSNDMEIEDVSESAGLIATVDTACGIIQTDEMYLDNEYKLKILKVRDGEGKGNAAIIKCDYTHMKLKETGDVITE